MNKDKIFEYVYNQLFISLNESNNLDPNFNYYQAISTDESYLKNNIFYFEPNFNSINELDDRIESLLKTRPDNDYLLLLKLVFKGKVLQDINSAELVFDKINKSSIISFQANVYMGGAYLSVKHYDKAKKHFRAATEIDDSIAKPYFNIGFTEFLQENYVNAIRYFKTAKEKDPNLIEGYLKLIQIYEIQKEHTNMLNEINAALKKWGNHPLLLKKKRLINLLPKFKDDSFDSKNLFHIRSVSEVYDILDKHYPGYKLISQKLIDKDGKKADVMEIDLNGEMKKITFVYN